MSGLYGKFEKICFLVVSFVFGIYFPIQILELFDYKWFVSYVVQMWYKEINNNSELNKKKKVGNCTDYLLIFIDFSCCLY